MARDKEKLPWLQTGLINADLHLEWYYRVLPLLISGSQASM